jgi:hypothetical protein
MNGSMGMEKKECSVIVSCWEGSHCVE